MPDNLPQDGYSPVISEISLLAGGVTYRIPTQDFLQRIEMTMAAGQAWSATIDLFDATSHVIEDLLTFKGGKQEAVFMFRWGWDGPRGISDYEWFHGQVGTYELDFTPSGTQIRINLVAQGVLQCYIDRKIRSWDAGTNISQIFQDIADDRGWQTGGVVQSTSNVLAETAMRGESDINFIKTQLMPYALDNKNRGGFSFFFDKNNRAHFHNNYFLPLEETAHYIVNRDPKGKVISFKPQSMDIFAGMMGSGNNIYQSVDSKSGSRIEIVSSYENGPPDTTVTTNSDSLFKRDLGNPESVHSHITFFEREPEEVKARVSNQFEKMRQITYTATLIVKGTHDIGVLDHISVDVLRPDGTNHYLSGSFLVSTITHSFDSGGAWTTELLLMREGKQFVPNSTEQTADVKIQSTLPLIFPNNGPASAQDFIPVELGGNAPRRG